jgi:F-type H+-transporting ATPase subunit b
VRTHKYVALATVLLNGALAFAADEHSGEKPSLFNADVGNFLFTLIIFGAVIAILGKYAWKPLLNVLNERERSIREALESARQEREAAKKLLGEYETQLARAREEASALVAEGRRDAEATARRIQEEARREADETVVRAKREIQLATDSARKELHDEVSNLAVRIAGTIIRKELTSADHRQLVADALREISTADTARKN